ncbi:hypothetical protein [Corynebacterium sphenisci]|uniref:hypothetical protein n=1 Tax=Corynebacterium sphenisci TaxID=191493 RepID=UPI0026E085EB|nr:hypothetical protein [Corynebacterium sphenisci]MDO5730307.1 hypothetical protein [Corynebacterium sphenisci]
MIRHRGRRAAIAALAATALLAPPAAAAPRTPAAPDAAGSAAIIGELLPEAMDAPGGIPLEDLERLVGALGDRAEAALRELLEQSRSPRTERLTGDYGSDAADPAGPFAAQPEPERTAEFGDRTERSDFWFPAAVAGCGVGEAPGTVARATVQPGPNFGAGPILGKGNLIAPYIPAGHALFHILVGSDRLVPVVQGTDMKVLWLNLSTARGGIADLDDTVLGAGLLAQTSRLVDTGEGGVIAAIYGSAAYADGDVCRVSPTLGGARVGGQSEKIGAGSS